MGTVVNVSAGSLLLRVPTARASSGRAGGDSAGAAVPGQLLLLGARAAPEGARAEHHPPPMCRARMLDRVASPARGGGGETSVKITLQLCQHVAPTLQMLQCYFIQVSLWLPV